MTRPDSLVRKQNSAQSDWITAWDEIRLDPDHDRAGRLVKAAAARMRDFTKGRKSAFGWSGGKDSLALEVVSREAGLRESLLVTSALEFPAFETWTDAHAPEGLTVHRRDSVNMDWLLSRPEMLFPRGPSSARWFQIVQHAGQRAHAKASGLEVLAMGRRRSDGNYLGPSAGASQHAYRDNAGGGFIRYSPISDWSHEDVLHVLVSYGMSLPPNYHGPRGFRVGTGPWPSRQWTESDAQGWAEIHYIDPSILTQAASVGLRGAVDFLDGLNNSIRKA